METRNHNTGAAGGLKALPVYIDGEWLDLMTRQRRLSFNPSTARPWYSIPECSEEDVDRAVSAAHRAFHSEGWRTLSPTERGRLVCRMADAVLDNRDRLAEVESVDCGKVISETRRFVQSCADYLRFFGELADKITGDTFVPPHRGIVAMTQRVPIGVVAAIVPWNNPLWLLSMKLGPALAAGNTLVIKPSEICAAPVIEFLHCITRSVDLPPGVLNLVTGSGEACGRALTSHPKVSKIAFTGGPETARHIVRNSAANLAEVTLELGGKSPAIVFDDADLDKAVASITSGVFLGSAGQSCVAASRALVQRSVYRAFVQRITASAEGLRVADPLDESAELGPLATEQQLVRIEQAIASAVGRGGQLATGGSRVPDRPGWYFSPTVVELASNTDDLAQTELFGPVLAVIPFDDEEEALSLANSTRFGLAAGIFTRDVGRVHRMTGRLRAGIQFVNCYRMGAPMGPIGGFGDSGKGREGGIDAVRDFTKPVTVWIDTRV